MRGFWIGPIDPMAFLKSFLPTTKKIPHTKLSKADFSNVPREANAEKDIYEPLMNSINTQKFLPHSLAMREHPTASTDTRTPTPALALHRTPTDERSRVWETLELSIACTSHPSKDAFIVDHEDTLLAESHSEHGKHTQKRIISYANSQFTRQHRTFAFSVLVCGSHARFIRWDRAGAIVSKHFDFHRNPRLFAEFFWRFGRLSLSQRGHDPTARLAGAEEEILLRNAVMSHIADPTKRQIAKLQNTCDSTYPCYDITVADSDGAIHHFLVQRPVSSFASHLGRSTRGYFALDVASGELVFLKDYWRPIDPTRAPEAEVYEALKEAGVPHLPCVRLAGDVAESGQCSQRTLSEEWRDANHPSSSRCPREYRHHRVVQDVAYSLNSVKNSRELAQALRNAVECIVSAHESQWLHRDLSAGNVMLSEDGLGILNDWDHGIHLDAANPAASQRTGTWKFLSSELAKNPNKIHELVDDLEACFWVLLWQATRLFEYEATFDVDELFDEYTIESQCNGEAIAGWKKTMFFFRDARRVTFSCKPLQYLISSIRHHFRSIIGYKYEPEKMEEAIRTSGTDVLRLFDEALAMTEWPEADVLSKRRHSSSSSGSHEDSAQSTLSHSASDPSPPKDSGYEDVAMHEEKPVPVDRRRGKRRVEDRGDEESVESVERSTRSSKRSKTDRSSPTTPHIGTADSRTKRRQAKTRSSKQKASSDDGLRRITRSQTKAAQRLTRSRSAKKIS